MWSRYRVAYTTHNKQNGVANIDLLQNDYGMIDMVDLVNAVIKLDDIREVLELEHVKDFREGDE